MISPPRPPVVLPWPFPIRNHSTTTVGGQLQVPQADGLSHDGATYPFTVPTVGAASPVENVCTRRESGFRLSFFMRAFLCLGTKARSTRRWAVPEVT